MSIRRIGGFHPSVQTAHLVEAQRRVQSVEKHAGTDDTELLTEEQALEALNARQQAELDALEAERAQRAREVEELRAKLMLSDGYEAAPRELVDLKGGATEKDVLPDTRAGAGKPGVSLAHLARANVYESVSRAERAAAERAAVEQAEAERAALAQAEAASVDTGPVAGVEDNWMEAELSVLQSDLEELEALEEAEEAYSDPGADSFVASLDDIANLEEGGVDVDDPGADSFVASLDDIAHLVPESAPETSEVSVTPSLASEPSVIISDEVSAAVPGEAAAVSSLEPQASSVGLPFDDEPKAG
ncbi:hypothetical protein F0U61_02300 [Archangium violaceum]|uniref:hypothetical protein n=1 Tax=Archangium violaceum TaxID=83451 RepID=UPI002B30B3E9|nr:hypothetical protein F0U61_02300 [Archangium violaceum]